MAASAYITDVLSDSPVVFWEAQDASGNPTDSSGNSRPITSITGSPTYHASGPDVGLDYGIEFDAGEDARRSTLISTVTNDFTMECWLMWRSGSQDRVITNGSLGANGWGVYLGSAHKLFALAGGVGQLADGTTAFTADVWHHVAVVRDSGNGNKWTYYLDGLVDKADAGTTSPNAPSGGFSGFGSTDGAGQQRIAYVAIYSTALSAARVASHYASMVPISVALPFISAATMLYAPSLQGTTITTPFIASATTVYALTLSPSGSASVNAPFIASATVVHAPTLSHEPVNTVAPVITGTPRRGSTLAVSTGTWIADGALVFTYQWQQCNSVGASCVDITAETASTYVVRSADVGNTLRAKVTATNA